jgi:hypothetical protein
MREEKGERETKYKMEWGGWFEVMEDEEIKRDRESTMLTPFFKT